MRYLRILDTQVLEDMLLMHGFTAYNGMLYGVTWDEPKAKLAKIDPVTLSYNVVELESGMGNDIKPAKGYLWAITYWHNGVYLYRIDPTDLSYTLFKWSGVDYPHSIAYDNNNTLYIGGSSGGILKVDISNTNNPIAERIPTGHYMHHTLVWCGNTNKLVFSGISVPFTSWDALYYSDKYLSIYNPTDNSILDVGVAYGCTDDGATVGKYVYFAVESIPAYPAWPRTIYKIDTNTGTVAALELDAGVVSPYADGIYYYDGKLLISYRASGARDGTIVTLNPNFTDIEYFSTAYEGYDLAPDEIAQIGNTYFGTSEHGSVRRVFSFDFFTKACSEYLTQPECETAGCYWWLDNTCHSEPEMLCPDYNNQLECESAGCYWYNNACHVDPPTPPCSSYTDPTECYINGCYWWSGACHEMPLSCVDITDRTECINAGCYWYLGACHEDAPPSCDVFDNKQDCESAGCYWYNNACHSTSPTCPDYNNQPECEGAGCYWYNNSCHSTISCSHWTNQADCVAHGCYWYEGSCHSTPEPTPPIAVIDSINPNPAEEGIPVTFSGHGVTEGSLLEYEWSSNIVGLLSAYSSFSKNDLPVGTHVISFRVKDNLYGWSDPAIDTLVINPSPVCEQWTWKIECQSHGCYWYNHSCHTNPAICSDYNNQIECESAGCYWYNNACHSTPEPTPPIAVIDSINPNPATEAEGVTFIGYGVTEGHILEYEWMSDIAGLISSYRTFTKDDLPVGEHTISFRVKDDLYGWSEPAIDTLVIEEVPECSAWTTKDDCEAHNCYWYNDSCHASSPTCPDYNNQPECVAANCYWYNNACHSSPQSIIPIATIDSINPNPAEEGIPVTFNGHGYDPDGGTITGYEWTSDILGLLSTYSTFTKNNLPIGDHNITFRVRDDEGDWSLPVTDTLVITGELYTFNLPSKGDSYISMPVIPADPSPDAVFGHGSGVIILEFDLATQLYVSPSTLECAKGYYLYSSVAKTVTVSGTDCIVTIQDIINVYDLLSRGEYALVGPGTSAIDITGSVLEGKVLGYDRAINDFVPVNILNPQEGYWIEKKECEDYETQLDCESAGCYWYNNSCHDNEPTCPDYNNQIECEAANCYWYNNSCHLTLPTCEEINNHSDCERFTCYWWSDNACHSEPEPFVPTAYIDYISPNPAVWGDVVTFEGHGYDPDGTIIAYEWTSDIVGFLSNTDTFTKSDLQAGEHTISFRVQDNDENWSVPAVETLIIKEAVACPIAVVSYNTYLIDALGPIREFRDKVLKPHKLGKKFVSLYYNKITPILSPILSKYYTLRIFGRTFVKLLLYTLSKK